MPVTGRVIDEQKENMEELKNLYANFKKEGIERRTQERKEKYDKKRALLWTAIEEDHRILMEASPPKAYEIKFKEASEINAKFYEKLKTWVPTTKSEENKQDNGNPSKITTQLTTDEPRQQQAPPLSSEKGQRHFLSTAQPTQQAEERITPSNNTENADMRGAASFEFQHSQNSPDLQNITQSGTSRNDEIPMSGGTAPLPGRISWNQFIDMEQQEQSTTSNIERILMMLAQNQLAQSSMKPPEIELKLFNGDVNHFNAFKDSFTRTIRNTNWGRIDLFLYLRSKLTGPAYDAVSKMEISEQSYVAAWEILERRFNNKRKRLESTMQLMNEADFQTQPNKVNTFTTFVNIYQNVRANIKQIKATTDDLLMEIVLSKMDEQTKGRFEDFIGRSTTTPTFMQLDDFFEKESIVCKNKEPASFKMQRTKQQQQQSSTRVHITQDAKGILECFLCKKDHLVIECDEFLANNDRERLLRKNHICIYCVAHKYDRNLPCQKRKYLKCGKCNGKHITLMHRLSSENTPERQNERSNNVLLTQGSVSKFSILPTAVANILSHCGDHHQVRCLVDLCAERSYICEDLVQKLRLKKFKTKVTITGINGIKDKATSYVNLTIKLDDTQQSLVKTEALVVPKVTGMLPANASAELLKKLNVQLADPFFYKQSFVGVLLGIDVAVKLFKQDVPNKITSDGLLLQPTHLGWIVSGSTEKTSDYVSTFVTLNESLTKAWQDPEIAQRILEFYELPESEENYPEENAEFCEQLYQEKHYRLNDGRYVVPIPWMTDGPALGHSYRKALQMFKVQERKWSKNPDHYALSNKFMEEYERLGHMTRLSHEHEKDDGSEVYYIPYLSILRQESLTTKLRNVFNASMPSSNGVSLNDTMWEGPKLQTNIKDVLLTARSFKYIYAADISMMFRQILVREEDREKLRIIWRPSSNETLREYKLNTVTYGTDAAPYLAIRTIHQCSQDNAPTQEIENIIRRGFYMDDLLYGANSIEDSKRQIAEIKSTLAAGKLPLTKWLSNNSELLEDVSLQNRITSFLPKEIKTMKLLGMLYNFEEDHFQLNYKEPENIKFTKRGISSAAASFYDPLGFILPFVMLLRIFLQNVWRLKVTWDEKLEDSLMKQFTKCINGISLLNKIRIPRHIPSTEGNQVEFIGFSDASNHAQAAVIYSRIRTATGYKVTLVTSKGNVTKFKNTLVLDSKQCTIPKLELQALTTLAELVKNLKHCFAHMNTKFTAYTDSKVVLAWIRSHKQNINRFVARRVMKITAVLEVDDIHYVKTDENPADPASRGMTAEQLANCELWFNGPAWLQDENLPTTPYEAATVTSLVTTTEEPDDIFSGYSSWSKVIRIVAYCLRWRKEKKSGYLKGKEILEAKYRVIKFYQQLHLKEVIQALHKQKTVPRRHWLYNMTPFLDQHGIIRVGGRLGNAEHLKEQQKHPIVIPKGKCQQLLIDYTHKVNLHASNSLTMQILASEYWITGIKRGIKTCINKCVKCIRWNAKVIQPQMSQLPMERITPAVTFEKVGVDLCGPFSIKASPLRNDRKIKVWVVNIVCLVTKAVHLELVTSLTTEHFLAAFSRFCSRRGTSSEVWSDNGTNFVGANRLLQDTWKELVKQCEQQTAMQEVTWKFIPKHSPTFGGLWEACVKSMKYFVRRMADVTNLTYEEFETLLCKIEALLNSRPLHPNPLTPHDDLALTPFHFINQRGFKPTAIDGLTKVPLTKKWLMIKQINHQFWQRFQMEYLQELQAMTKWQKPQRNLNIDDLVLIKEPSATPGDWRMGKIVKIYPDHQGTVRKVDVVTATKKEATLHATNRLVPLLPEEEIEANNNKGEPRKSKRIAHNRISALHLCLLVLLALSPSAKSTNPEAIEPLQPGVHLKQLNGVYRKAFEMEFKVSTNLNITDDLMIIEQGVQAFAAECQRFADTDVNLSNNCLSTHTSLRQLANQVTSEISTRYNQSRKSKRWLGLTSKVIWKAAPAVLTAGGMVYQETQIFKLTNQLAETRENMRKTANVLLKIQDLEYEAVSDKLNEVIKQQNKLQLAETINDFAEQSDLLLRRIKAKYDDANKIQPLEELKKYADPLYAKMKNIGLPDFGGSIFSMYPTKQEVTDDMVTITFTIPVVNKPKLTHWAVISVPTSKGQLTLLSNQNKIQRIVVSPSTNKFADVSEHPMIHSGLLEDMMLTTMDDCTKAIFNNQSAVTSECQQEIIPCDREEVVSIFESTAVVYRHQERPLKFTCDTNNFTIETPAAIINVKACKTHSEIIHFQNAVEKSIDITANPQVLELNQNPELANLKKSIQDQWISGVKDMRAGNIIAIILATATIAIFLVILVRCIPRRQNNQMWLPQWVGPIRTA